jgi:hypothetical protein
MSNGTKVQKLALFSIANTAHTTMMSIASCRTKLLSWSVLLLELAEAQLEFFVCHPTLPYSAALELPLVILVCHN